MLSFKKGNCTARLKDIPIRINTVFNHGWPSGHMVYLFTPLLGWEWRRPSTLRDIVGKSLVYSVAACSGRRCREKDSIIKKRLLLSVFLCLKIAQKQKKLHLILLNSYILIL